MSETFSRRGFLSAAGGITFLALTPIGRGLFAVEENQRAGLPLFTALPYIQPGSGSRLVPGREAMVLAWQTENAPAQFEVNYGPTKTYGQSAKITRTPRLSGDNTRLNYAANLENLPLGQKIFYRVSGNGKVVVEGFFTTRQSRGTRTRFAAIGDNACRNVGNRNIAFQAYLTHPDFVVNVGDSVYDHGLDSEYTEYFFTVFNSDRAETGVGAPLLRSVPYYSVLGNHDINFTNPETKRGFSIADFDNNAGALGYYTNMYLPANGPTPATPTPIRGAAARVGAFKTAAGERFPNMANYSFDYGSVHFLCLDSNLYVDPTNAAWQNWLIQDLNRTDARWKFVIHHHPAFNVGDAHFTEQQMRVLAPLWESNGVDLVLSGHEHTYQRTMPFRFAPRDSSKANHVFESDRLIPGTFTVDRDFDGRKNTRPNGVIYLTTGAGGQNLHDQKMTDKPEEWTHARDDHAAYAARVVADRHSFSLFDVSESELTLTQIDENGQNIDQIRITKA